MYKSKIIGTGSFIPQKIMTNDDLSQFLDTSDEWIKDRTGIKIRHIALLENGESHLQMALEASKNALQMANLDPKKLDMIIVATVTQDNRLPSVACQLQDLLEANNAFAFDVQAACAGSIYALNIAHSFIATGQCKNVLYVGVEFMSKVVDWQDRNTAVLFGDGASAAVLTSTEEQDKGFIDFILHADGKQKDIIHIKGLLGKIQMNGRETYKFAVRSLCEASQEILSKNQASVMDLDWVVPHQANLRIIEAIALRLSIPMEKFLINLDRYANTSAASLMLAFDEASREKKLKTGDLVLMMAIGGGFAWGCALYKI